VLAQPDIPERWRTPDFGSPLVPVVPVQFARDGVSVHYFSMVTTVGTPQDIAAQEIRLESFFPADGPHHRPPLALTRQDRGDP
jgi:hypothetical protein